MEQWVEQWRTMRTKGGTIENTGNKGRNNEWNNGNNGEQ